MDIKKEIAKTISDNWPFEHLVDDLEELFKKWALEMVGDEASYNPKDPWMNDVNSPEALEGYNQAKEEIREKIMEGGE